MKTEKILPKNPSPFDINGCYIAGGSILSIVTEKEINDFDIYPKSKKDFENILVDLIEKESCYIINISERAVTLKSRKHKNYLNEEHTAQVVFFNFYNNPEELFENFDFTVCMAAFDCDSLEYHFHPNFYQDVASKTLRFNENALFPINSLLRVKKYSEKGYELGKICTIKLAFSLMNKGLPKSWKEMEDEVGGLYGNKIINFDIDNIDFSYDNLIKFLDEIDEGKITQDTPKIKKYDILNYNCHNGGGTTDDKEIEYFKINEKECLFVEENKIKEKVPVSFINNIGEKIKLKDIGENKNKKFFGYKVSDYIYPLFTKMNGNVFKDKQKAMENMEDNKSLYIVTVSLEDMQGEFAYSDDDIIICNNAKPAKKITSFDDSMDDDILEAFSVIMAT